MLTLHRGANTIVTDDNFSVKMKWVNPACYMDKIPGDVGLGLDISVNEYTRKEFGNPERFEKYSSGQDRKFPDISVRFSGMLLMRGTLVINNATADAYSGWLQSELGVMGTAQRDRFITDLPWPTAQTFVSKTVYDPDVDDYDCTPVGNPGYWEGKGREKEITIYFTDSNGLPASKQEMVTDLTIKFRDEKSSTINWREGGDLVMSGEATVISPYLFLNYAVKELLKLNKFFVDQDNNALEDPFFQIAVYHNYNILMPSYTEEILDTSYWDYDLNDWVERFSNNIILTGWATEAFDYANLLPRIPVSDFILGLQNWLNIVFFFRNDSIVHIINRNDLPGAESYDLDKYFLGFWTMGERKNVRLKFIQELDDNDKMISEEWHDLSDRIDDFKAAVDTKAELEALTGTEFGELRLVRSENKIYERRWAVFAINDPYRFEDQIDVLEWVVASIGGQYLFYGDADEIEEIKTGCSTLNSIDDSGILQKTIQKGNMRSTKNLWTDFSFRCIGLGLLGLNGSLAFDGELGLFNQRWKNWANFWKNRLPVEGDFKIPANELYYIINNITQPYSTRHGKFLIEEMECDFRGDRMGNVHIKGYKL